MITYGCARAEPDRGPLSQHRPYTEDLESVRPAIRLQAGWQPSSMRPLAGPGVTMRQEHLQILQHLLAAVVAGVSSVRRSSTGPAAHSHLVCIASSLLMLVTLYQRSGFQAARKRCGRSYPHGSWHHDGDRLPGCRGDFKESLTFEARPPPPRSGSLRRLESCSASASTSPQPSPSS
jgi:hypothetical protein